MNTVSIGNWPCALRLAGKRTAALALAFVLAAAARAETPRPFSHPERVRYDSNCLTIDGKDTFIYSGAFHYFRCPKPLWRERFEKIRDAGFNTVETYVAWDWHEREMPSSLDDDSKIDLTDLDDWLTMAEQFGFYVIIRPGPYICAEWNTGGYPQWLLTKKPASPLRSQAWLRTDDPVYLDWCRHWYNAVCPVIARHQITAKAPGQPGIILFQLENEYDYAGLPADVMVNQLKVLADCAHAKGINVPLFTCWTHPVRNQTNSPAWLRGVFDSCNFYPRWGVNEIGGRIATLRREQPDAPLMTTELQGGWFSEVGGKLSMDQDGLTASQINNLTLFAIQNGDTILNYYMLFGGTNPGDWGARNITTTYDYGAPIHEWGTVGARYLRVWALGHMLREHGARLARSQEVPCDVTTSQHDVTVALRRAPDGSRYLFVRTSQHTEPRQGSATVKERAGASPEIHFDYNLEPFGSVVLYLPPGASDPSQGEWLPHAAPPLSPPASSPAPIVITTALRHADPGPANWSPLQSGEDLAHLGIDDSGFIFYRAHLQGNHTNLFAERPEGDDLLATLDGQSASRGAALPLASTFSLPATAGDLLLLYENHGHANGGAAMEARCGVFSLHTSATPTGPERAIAGWRMRQVDSVRRRPETKTDFQDAGWPAVDVANTDADTLPAHQSAVYRATVDLTDADLNAPETDVKFGRIDDEGWIYVNGKRVGQSDNWSRPWSFDATKALHPGRNVIAVIVRNNDGDGGIGAPVISWPPKGTPVPLSGFGIPTGVAAHWWNDDLNDRAWQTVSIGQESAASDSSHADMLNWYRLKFQLPSGSADPAIPLRFHLDAKGNGFLYLNGRPLGRYWQAGPQHDFFLPACWLNAGHENVLTLCLRPVNEPDSITAAAIEPYDAL